MLSDNLKLSNYKITGDPEEADNDQHYSPEIEDLIRKTYIQVHKKKIHSPVKLLKLIEKYPNVPAFKNYLTVFYNIKGKKDKAHQANRWLAKEHPDYLYGKLNLAANYIEEGQLEEVPKILGEALDLQDLYPDRKVFHISEFQSFFNIACHYLIKTENFEAVETRIEMAEEVLGEDNPVIAQIYDVMEDKKEELAFEREEAMDAKRGGKPIGRSYDTTVQTDQAPTFHHEEIEELYKYGIEISHDVLRKILALPRETLIEDLGKVLNDSLYRFEFFKNKIKKEGWEDEEMAFSLHALFLLTELKATDQLPLILDHIKQGDDFLEFWYSDHTTETLWHILFHLGKDQLPLLQSFVLERDVHYSPKWAVMSAVNQIGLHFPEREKEVLDWFESLMDEMIEHHEDPYFVDPKVGGMLAIDVCGFDAAYLIPKIKKLYDLRLVDEPITGGFKDLVKEINIKDPLKYDLYDSIFTHYEYIKKEWLGIMTPEEKAEKERKMKQWMEEHGSKNKSQTTGLNAPAEVKKSGPKVGRNDPCPCGSGKKYKKCCLGK